ncbi:MULTISPECIES: hypothetical protein [Mesorhizobium]|uniref:hypothetical protein n=1 Tax=Mesorhizobium sp. TaxID=1871066 RepID=UPI000AB9CAC5|nr:MULTISPECIES: hypothetical protein [Mesorhizobium]
MAVDNDFIERFEKEIKLLKDLQKAASDSIERAEKRLERIRNGEHREVVFGRVPPKQ